MANQTPKSYRLSEDTIKKLDAVLETMKTEDKGVNWDSCFAALMDSYESQAAAIEAERPQEEKDFRALLSRIGDAYKSALTAIAAADDRAAADYAKRLNTAETAVSTLKEKATAAQETAKRYQEEVQTLTAEVERLEKELAATNRRADATEASLAEIRESKNLLAEQFAKAQKQLSNIEELTKAAAERDALKVSIEEIRKQADLDRRAAVLAEREASAAQLDKLRGEYAKVIEKLAATATGKPEPEPKKRTTKTTTKTTETAAPKKAATKAKTKTEK